MDATTNTSEHQLAPTQTQRRRIHAQIPDDKAMLRAAAELTRDINTARPEIYWPDMIISALVGYGALAGAILVESTWLAVALGVVSVLALYRALLFIHEITHLHRDALPGFRTAWNLLVGIPMLTPSLMYEQVHTLHHARTKYGTVEDPEYMPLALMKPWSLPLFVLVAALAPVALIVRWGILAPLGLVIPPLRKAAWERFSSLSINPSFRRRPPSDKERGWFLFQQIGASVWAMFLISTPFWLGWRPLLIAAAITAAVAVFNQLRTLVAHLWENEGEAMTVTAQYLDSVNVPSFVAGIWAPVGLRYHALHHLIPSMPYHSLHEAHRRIHAHLGTGSTFGEASHAGMWPLVGRIARSTMGRR
ncbi:fatty acid desaturase family protein [Aurantiacibacter poecillastricola]|uniref:fatty acid desaturase family protein n=1 Tax=Aurantiacibacter poecillastricola TaxID=3064385 RepID=UPI00273E5572|nr:fatty acid desaturase [Aurantiacibacter sp. 219JJ12-13]MDP5261179.1 fatty acid desaturase [Aurantiacibacter sp. 219JJ12-13]